MEEKITDIGVHMAYKCDAAHHCHYVVGKTWKITGEKTRQYEKKETGWMINITNRINTILCKLSHVNLIRKCKKERKYTHKQEIIQEKLRPMYASTRKDRLTEVETRLRHDLSVQNKILRDKKAISERQRIIALFNSSLKNVCRGFRKNGRIDVEKTPPKKDVKIFWENIWSKQGTFNQEG